MFFKNVRATENWNGQSSRIEAWENVSRRKDKKGTRKNWGEKKNGEKNDLKTEQEKLKLDYELQKAMVKMKIFEEADKLEARPDQDPALSKLPKYDNFTKDYVENLKTVKDDVIGQDDSSYKTDMISMLGRSRASRIDLGVFQEIKSIILIL